VSDGPVQFTPTEKARMLGAEIRVAALERRLGDLDRASTHLSHYVRGVHWPPSWDEWQLICDQVFDLVGPNGPRDPRG